MKRNVFLLLLLAFFVSAGFAQEMKVASYNIRYDNINDGDNIWENRKDHLNALIRYHDFDIMGTQEALKNQLDDILRLEEYTYVGVGRDDGKDAGEHSAVFYKKDRFLAMETGDFWYSETSDKPSKGWDATCCNRICSWVKLKDLTSNKEFYVFNSHFDHQGVEARRNSGILLAEKIKEIASGFPVIFMGDFNSRPEAEHMVSLSSKYKDAFTHSLDKPYGPVGTFNNFKFDVRLKNRIDYIFTDDNFDILKYATLTDSYDQKFPSDHLPIVAHLKLK